MESPSAKVSIIFQNEKKLKQATLPFEILKINPKNDSSLLKRQKLPNFKKAQCDDDVVIIEETQVNGEKRSSPERDSSQMDVEEITSEIIAEVVNEVENNKIQTDKIVQEESDSNDVVLIQNIEDVSVNKNFNKPVDDIEIVEDDNLKSNKRKLESVEEKRESKPYKRVKLIYNVDKINMNKGSSVSNVNSVNTDCGNHTKIEEQISKDCKESSTNVKAIVSYFKSDKGKSDVPIVCQMSDLEEVKTAPSDEAVVKESNESSNGGNSSCSKDNDSDRNDKCKIEDSMDVESSSSIEVISAADSCEDNCTSPSLKSENCSPSGKNTVKQLTAKQLERKAEVEKRRKEIQQERERKKKEKIEEKARLKQEKEEERKKVKEEKEKKRMAEIEMKNEEKRRKEEEKRKKEEEKQEEKRKKEEQKQEDKRKKEEMQKKKEEEQEMQKNKLTKEAEVFSSFFKKFDSKTTNVREDEKLPNEVVFMPFAVRVDMRLAPVNRNPMDDERRSKFEELVNAQSAEIIYLEELLSGAVIPKKSDNTWPLEEKYGEVVVLDEGLDLNDEIAAGPEKKFNDRRPKLLQFHENRRPPYWGTWRKKSRNIRPKNPLGKDEVFDYEVDSDDEWEEEEPGESLHGSDDEKESEDEYEVDNDFFVPHGYLSDDENPEEEIISPETQKAKLKLLGEQFDLERNEKTKLLKPILLGCIWFNNESDEPSSANPSVVKFLNKRKAIPWTDSIPIPVLQDENTDPSEIMLSDSGTPTSHKETAFPESAIPELITLICGSTMSRKNLAKTFAMHWNKKQEESMGENEGNVGWLSQARVNRKIKELAKWEEFPEEGPFSGKLCWHVKKEVREKFGIADLPILQKVDDISEVRDGEACKRISPSLITKFTKVLTEDERRNQITKARKSLSLPKPLTESVPNSSKQVTPLKCLKKLKEFWAKPSVTSKYTPTVAVDPDEVMIIDSSTEKEDVAVSRENTTQPVNDERNDAESDKMEDEQMHENDSTDKIVSAESSSECNNEVSSSENACTKQTEVDPKPVVKKRVAILFSAPRGCEIVKPEVPAKKSAISLDEVVKKYENSIGDEVEIE